MLAKVYLPMNVIASGIVALLVMALVLLPGGAPVALAQSVPPACLNDGGNPVMPSAGAGIGAWLIVLNFNHAPSTTTTTGCMVRTIALNPQKVVRSFVMCQLVNNQAQALVGGGAAAFDGKFSIQCPGVNEVPGVSQNNTNYTIWGRANFAQTPQTYAIVSHADVALTASTTGSAATPNSPWYATLNSRYGGSTFVSSDTTINVRSQIVRFESAVARGTGTHTLNQTALAPGATLAVFSFHYDQPITIGGAGPLWTLHELVIDPPGGCCKGG